MESPKISLMTQMSSIQWEFENMLRNIFIPFTLTLGDSVFSYADELKCQSLPKETRLTIIRYMLSRNMMSSGHSGDNKPIWDGLLSAVRMSEEDKERGCSDYKLRARTGDVVNFQRFDIEDRSNWEQKFDKIYSVFVLICRKRVRHFVETCYKNWASWNQTSTPTVDILDESSGLKSQRGRYNRFAEELIDREAGRVKPFDAKPLPASFVETMLLTYDLYTEKQQRDFLERLFGDVSKVPDNFILSGGSLQPGQDLTRDKDAPENEHKTRSGRKYSCISTMQSLTEIQDRESDLNKDLEATLLKAELERSQHEVVSLKNSINKLRLQNEESKEVIRELRDTDFTLRRKTEKDKLEIQQLKTNIGGSNNTSEVANEKALAEVFIAGHRSAKRSRIDVADDAAEAAPRDNVRKDKPLESKVKPEVISLDE